MVLSKLFAFIKNAKGKKPAKKREPSPRQRAVRPGDEQWPLPKSATYPVTPGIGLDD